MAWIPGISTLDAGAILIPHSDLGLNRDIRLNLENRTAYQYMNYQNADIFTLQNAALARFNQPVTIDKFSLDLQPRMQLSDIMAARKANNG